MAYINTAPLTHTSPLSRWFAARVAEYQEAARRRTAYRQTLAELEAMTDRDLNDLGISRASIHELARQAAAMA